MTEFQACGVLIPIPSPLFTSLHQCLLIPPPSFLNICIVFVVVLGSDPEILRTRPASAQEPLLVEFGYPMRC